MAFHLPPVHDANLRLLAWLGLVSLLLTVINQSLDILKKASELKKTALHKLYTLILAYFKKTSLGYTVLRFGAGVLKKTLLVNTMLTIMHRSKKNPWANGSLADFFKKFSVVTSHKKTRFEKFFLIENGPVNGIVNFI